ncbi:MAG: hypothetical protein AAF799_42695 [Myxococcota bacterium]
MKITRVFATVFVAAFATACKPTEGATATPGDVNADGPVVATAPTEAPSTGDDQGRDNQPQIDDEGPSDDLAPSGNSDPNPYIAPLLRHAGDLTVHAPPQARTDFIAGRLRSHIEGALSKGRGRVWVGPQVPGFVVLMEGSMELFLLDRVGDEFLAFYRDPYGAGSCQLGDETNCHFFARLYDIEGKVQWERPLHEALSAPSYLEIQDVRYADGTLYFNEACQSYSRRVKGKCSSLVAMDPTTGEVRWRTDPLVSNGEFLVHGDYIISGYGFTEERDHVFVVSRADGTIEQRIKVPKSPETFAVSEDDGVLEVRIYSSPARVFSMKDWDTERPRLVELGRASGGKGKSRRRR